MKSRLLLTIFTICICSTFTVSQEHNFTKSHDVFNDNSPNLIVPPYVYYPPTTDNPLLFSNVNISSNTAPQNEPSVKISRKNPNRVVAAWRDFRQGTTPAVRRVGYSYSTDGGVTWSPSTTLDSTLLGGGLLRNSDAAVTVDTAGNFYITTIALNNSNGNGTLAIYKSTDGGVTFPIAQILSQGQNEDKEMLTTDLVAGSPFKNNLYICWSRLNFAADIKLIRSTNAGVTWSAPVDVGTAGTSGQGSDVSVGINGEVYVVWTDYNNQFFSRSTDGGVTFSTPVSITNQLEAQIPFAQSPWVTFPSISTDISGGPRNGYIYVTWCDGRNAPADVYISRSTDHGITWSTSLKVNNDAVGNGKVHAWPWIAVNETGKIAITYYDTRNTPSNSIIEAWLAFSTDGGLTFTNQVMSSAQSPTNKPNTDVRFGDYINCDFVGNKVVPVWTDERAGGFDMDIYTAVVDITVGQTPVTNNIPKDFELKQNYPDPFNPETVIGFTIPKSANVTLNIYNSSGQLIESLINGSMNSGSYNVKWNAGKYSSGVYFYKLSTSDGFTETKKMILIK